MDQELLERFDLIERMVLEGRRSTQYWGWCLALWGSGQLIATAWATLGRRPTLAWAVTMAACAVATVVAASRKHSTQHSQSLIARAVWSVWLSLGISLSLLGFLGNTSGILTGRAFLAVFFSLMGFTYLATGLIIRWKVQWGIGLLWWAAAIVALYGPGPVLEWLFMAMVFLGEVVLGVYLMAREKADIRHARAA